MMEPAAFTGLDSLEELVLSNNVITSLERGMFDGLESLEELQLDNNTINLMEDRIFEHMGRLQRLDLSHNDISVLTPETLQGLTGLRYLNLHNNSMAIIGNRAFSHVTQLRRLDLSSNRIEQISALAFAGLVHLTHLNLQDNIIARIDHSTPMVLASLPALFSLNLKNNRLNTLNQQTFAPFWNSTVNTNAQIHLAGQFRSRLPISLFFLFLFLPLSSKLHPTPNSITHVLIQEGDLEKELEDPS